MRILPDFENVLRNSKGIMFYSVPHKGSVMADLSLPFLKKSIELKEIRRSIPSYHIICKNKNNYIFRLQHCFESSQKIQRLTSEPNS